MRSATGKFKSVSEIEPVLLGDRVNCRWIPWFPVFLLYTDNWIPVTVPRFEPRDETVEARMEMVNKSTAVVLFVTFVVIAGIAVYMLTDDAETYDEDDLRTDLVVGDYVEIEYQGFEECVIKYSVISVNDNGTVFAEYFEDGVYVETYEMTPDEFLEEIVVTYVGDTEVTQEVLDTPFGKRMCDRISWTENMDGEIHDFTGWYGNDGICYKLVNTCGDWVDVTLIKSTSLFS